MGRGHFKAMDLSEDAQVVIHSGFLANQTLEKIAAAVTEATKETIAISTLSRYRRWWKSEKRAGLELRDYMQELVASLKLFPADQVAGLVDQKLEALSLLMLRRLETDDPKAVVGLAQQQRKLGLAEDKLALDRERKRLQEQKLDLDGQLVALETRKVELRERATQAAQRITEKVKTVVKELPPDVARIIDEELYGLVS